MKLASLDSSLQFTYADDSYDRNLYPAGSCAILNSGKPTGPNGTECLFSELQDIETFRCVQSGSKAKACYKDRAIWRHT